VTESKKREAGNELYKRNSVIRRFRGGSKVSRRSIQFVRGREHWFSEGEH
jgi:hypothetical protein